MNAAVQEICKTCTNSDDRLKVAAIDMLTCLFDHSKVCILYKLLLKFKTSFCLFFLHIPVKIVLRN